MYRIHVISLGLLLSAFLELHMSQVKHNRKSQDSCNQPRPADVCLTRTAHVTCKTNVRSHMYRIHVISRGLLLSAFLELHMSQVKHT